MASCTTTAKSGSGRHTDADHVPQVDAFFVRQFPVTKGRQVAMAALRQTRVRWEVVGSAAPAAQPLLQKLEAAPISGGLSSQLILASGHSPCPVCISIY